LQATGDEDGDAGATAEEDWRAFRAKLVARADEVFESSKETPERIAKDRERVFRLEQELAEAQAVYMQELAEELAEAHAKAEQLEGDREAQKKRIRKLEAELESTLSKARKDAKKRASGAGQQPQEIEKGWVHPSPLIEQGSVLLGSPGDHFALQQACFHKAVILMLAHSDVEGDTGLILNRPTSQTMMVDGEPWGVWYGGPCEGPDDYQGKPSLCCLHTRKDLVPLGPKESVHGPVEIIPGVFSMDMTSATALVRDGKAAKEDFMLISGYCGWATTQLQRELDFDECWQLAAADSQALLGGVRRQQAALKRACEAGRGGCSGVGLPFWRRLFTRLREENAETADGGAHADAVLRLWSRARLGMERQGDRLDESKLSLEAQFLEAAAWATFQPMPADTVLYASSTDWIVDSPHGIEPIDDIPPQYMHKAVMALLRPVEDQESPAYAVLLNGPRLRDVLDGRVQDPLFGGNDYVSKAYEAYGHSFLGFVMFPPGVLQSLMQAKAIRLADSDVPGAAEMMKVHREERWVLAGGHVLPEEEADAVLGDEQQRLWWDCFLDTSTEDWDSSTAIQKEPDGTGDTAADLPI